MYYIFHKLQFIKHAFNINKLQLIGGYLINYFNLLFNISFLRIDVDFVNYAQHIFAISQDFTVLGRTYPLNIK